jgi:CRISP-associated protein Cas1
MGIQVYLDQCSRYDALADRSLRGSHTMILFGFGSTLSVSDGDLIVRNGVAHSAQKYDPITLHRGVHSIHDIIVLADSGTISLDALRWCRNQEICVTILDQDGVVIGVLTPEHKANAALRRCQYSVDPMPIGRWLLKAKTQSQIDVLRRHPELPDSRSIAANLESGLSYCPMSIDAIRTEEGMIAHAYFSAFVGHPLRWTSRKVLPHWSCITERTSPLAPNDNGRHAVNPYHAMINYALSLLESQARQEINAAGLDASCGYLHADKSGRDSLVYDIVEPHRAYVDHAVFQFVQRTTFHLSDFIRCDDGRVRLSPSLARLVSAQCRLNQRDVAQTVQKLLTFLR